ncbi:MAG: hypothetical protein E7208_08215 [Clostridium butyricum]|nr:hypothetical protein [Clostridium butyricum]
MKLFTVQFIGYLKKKVSLKDTLKIWIYSFIGNLIGIVILAYMFVESEANLEIIENYIEPIVYVKLNLSISQMVFSRFINYTIF